MSLWHFILKKTPQKNLLNCSCPVDWSFENRCTCSMYHTHTHTHTHDCKMSRAEANLRWLYVSADPALIQQTKLSLLNAQQKSSLAVIMQPPRPAAPQSTVLPSPLTSLTSLLSAIYDTLLVCIYYQLTDTFCVSQLISSRLSQSQRSPTLDVNTRHT